MKVPPCESEELKALPTANEEATSLAQTDSFVQLCRSIRLGVKHEGSLG